VTGTRAVRAAALAVVLLLAGCAQAAQGGPGKPPPIYGPWAADAVVLRVESSEAPQSSVGRFPQVSVYGDGRVIAEGPIDARYPGPALPNLLESKIDAAALQRLAQRAVDAGVVGGVGLGMPGRGRTRTRFTLDTGPDTYVRDVDDLTGLAGRSGLTGSQITARDHLRAFLQALSYPSAILGAGAARQTPYAPTAVAALATRWLPDPQLRAPDVGWPGPALPGEPLAPGLTCVLATGETVAPVLAAARSASALTPWLADDGTRWALLLRPLLPDESGCADLGD
jgi:hypothetical protein